MSDNYYVYGHYKDGVLKYVGKGKGARAFTFSLLQRRKTWSELFSPENPPEVRILHQNLSEDQALEIESKLINETAGLINLVKSKGHSFADYSKEDHQRLAEKRSGENHPFFGKKRSQATKDKISETKKANPTRYWLGKKRDPEVIKKFHAGGHSPEARAKQAAAKRGRTLSEEHKRKISEGGKGRVLSEETRKKISEAKKGKGNGRTGYKMSEETKEKLRQARKKNWADPEYRERMASRKKGWTSSKAKQVKCLENEKVYRCAKEAADDLGICEKGIQKVCSGNRKTTAGYSFTYTQ